MKKRILLSLGLAWAAATGWAQVGPAPSVEKDAIPPAGQTVEVKEFSLEYGGLRGERWRKSPDTDAPGSELILRVRTGTRVTLRLFRDFPARDTSFDIDGYDVHERFFGGPEERTATFVAGRKGLFPITADLTPRGGRIGLLVVQD